MEGFPSALLQCYAFLCLEQAGLLEGPLGTGTKIASICSAIFSMVEASRIISCHLPPEKETNLVPGGFSDTKIRLMHCVMYQLGL